MDFLIYIRNGLKTALSRRFLLMTLLFFIWIYRIAFMPARGGITTVIQVTCIFGMFIIAYRRRPSVIRRTMNAGAPVSTLLLFYTYALLSCTWAFLPFFSGFLSLQNLLFIFVLYWYFSMFRTFESLERGFLLLFLLVDIFEAVWWRIAIQPGALFTHQLGVGSVAAMMTAYCLAEFMTEKHNANRRRFLKICFIAAVVLLVVSTSSGANASAVAACAVAFLVTGKVAVCFLMLMFAIYLFYNQDAIEGLILMIMPGKTVETLETATGRQIIWDLMKELAAQKPLFGWGFACIERVATEYGTVRTPDAHNNYLGIYGSLGIVGCVFAGIHFLATLCRTYMRRMYKGYSGLLCGVVCALVNGYTFGFLSGKICVITMIYFALIVLTYFYGHVPSEVQNGKQKR